jgi:predicted neuraminidase
MSTQVIPGSGATTELIFTEAPFESCHASTIVELRNGDLLAAWFGGSAEGNPDVGIWGSRRTGGRWSAPARLAREPEVACYNPVLFYTRDERLWLYYRFGPDPASWVCGRRWSIDEGRTWSQVEHLGAGLYGPIRTKPLILEDGTIVGGTSVESYRSWACWIERSVDQGRTWSKSGPITISPEFAGSTASPAPPLDVPGSGEWRHTAGIIQPAVVCLGGERLRLYARSTSRTARICVADSFDAGLNWTGARPIDLPNPNSGVDAVALGDGRVVLAYNHSDSSARTPLNLAVSEDGERFRMFCALEDQPGEYSYPALIQGSDGNLHITYTWNRRRIRYVHLPVTTIGEASTDRCECSMESD